ncbi:hypothetical protein GCM10017744_101210 [Streptomyces antimycoticus]
MTVSLPLVLVLGAVAWIAIKFMGVRLWVAVVIALFGFWLAHTPLRRPWSPVRAPASTPQRTTRLDEY